MFVILSDVDCPDLVDLALYDLDLVDFGLFDLDLWYLGKVEVVAVESLVWLPSACW